MQHREDSFGQYLKEIGQYPLLEKEDEARLGQIIKEGFELEGVFKDSFGTEYSPEIEFEELVPDLETEERPSSLVSILGQIAYMAASELYSKTADYRKNRLEAQEEFTNSNLRLVVSIAKRYPKKPGLEMIDLVQEGSIGLRRAVEMFDYTRGFKFSTYATNWIKQAIGRAIAQQSNIIQIPGEQLTSLRGELMINGGDESKLRGNEARLLLLTTTASLDKSLSDDSSFSLGDTIASTDTGPEDLATNKEFIDSILEQLDERDRLVVQLKFGLNGNDVESTMNIANRLNVTPATVNNIINRVFELFRKSDAYA
jgi:RNA polymerase primary sigma factor